MSTEASATRTIVHKRDDYKIIFHIKAISDHSYSITTDLRIESKNLDGSILRLPAKYMSGKSLVGKEMLFHWGIDRYKKDAFEEEGKKFVRETETITIDRLQNTKDVQGGLKATICKQICHIDTVLKKSAEGHQKLCKYLQEMDLQN